MQMRSERKLPWPTQVVWDALNDPGVLEACIPGCESMTTLADDQYEALINTKIGPVKARFRGRVSVVDPHPPNAYTLRFDGQGGAAGFAKGEADVELAEGAEGCLLRYSAEASVGGKLAQVGSRLVQGSARKLADQFFDNLTTHLNGGEPLPNAGDDTDDPGGSGDGKAGEANAAGRGWRFWRNNPS